MAEGAAASAEAMVSVAGGTDGVIGCARREASGAEESSGLAPVAPLPPAPVCGTTGDIVSVRDGECELPLPPLVGLDGAARTECEMAADIEAENAASPSYAALR